MADIPQNLQIVVKTEQSPLTPEKSPNNIKERLNLHVKRRLQQEPHGVAPNKPVNVNDDVIAKRKEKQKEPQKTRRPYQKRADKTKTTTVIGESGRKNKRYKTKAGAELPCNPNMSDDGNPSSQTFPSMQGEDEGDGPEADVKSPRDKEKCHDVLNLVLNFKKRELMQNPEVQEFFSKIVNIIKS